MSQLFCEDKTDSRGQAQGCLVSDLTLSACSTHAAGRRDEFHDSRGLFGSNTLESLDMATPQCIYPARLQRVHGKVGRMACAMDNDRLLCMFADCLHVLAEVLEGAGAQRRRLDKVLCWHIVSRRDFSGRRRAESSMNMLMRGPQCAR